LGPSKEEEERDAKLRKLLGTYFMNTDPYMFQRTIAQLPSGARGKPLKAVVDRALKEYAQVAIIRRRQALIKENYASKIKIPNWLPSNRHEAFRAAMMNAATTPNAKGKYPTQKAVREAMNRWVNTHVSKVARAAYEKENMITGEIIKVPAYNPPKNPKVNVPKRLSPPKAVAKSPRAKAARGAAGRRSPAKPANNYVYTIPLTNNVANLGNAMIAAGLNIRSGHTWNELLRAGIDPKFKNIWNTHVQGQASGATGPIKRPLPKKKTRAEQVANLREAIENAGLNLTKNYTWPQLEAAGVPSEYKTLWTKITKRT
jgi:hypothetical protein